MKKNVLALCLIGIVFLTSTYAAEFPKFNFVCIDGMTINSKSLRGNAVFITFFARFCEPCKNEVPFLNDLQKKYGNSLKIIAIGYRENDPEKLRALAAEWNINYPVCPDHDGSAAALLGVKGLPRGFLLDQNGKLVASYESMNEINKKDLLNKLSGLQPEINKYHSLGPSFYIQTLDEATEGAAGEGKIYRDKILSWLRESNIRIADSPDAATYRISGSVSKIKNILGIEIVVNFEGAADSNLSGVVKAGDDSYIKKSLIDLLIELPYVKRK